MRYIRFVDLSTVNSLPFEVRSDLTGKVVEVHFVESFMIIGQHTCWSEAVMQHFHEVQDRCYAVSWLSLWRVAQDDSLSQTEKWLKANNRRPLFYFMKEHCGVAERPPRKVSV